MKKVSTTQAPQAIGPYEQAMKVNGFVYTSGQISLDPQSGELVGTTIEEQTHQVLKNLEAILCEAGSGLDSVVKTTCFLRNMEEFQLFNEVYGRFFDHHKPSRSAVEVSNLPKGALVEVEATALVQL